MATGDAIFSPGTQVAAITGAATRATGAFSGSGEVTALSTNVYPFGDAVLSCSFTVAPTIGGLVHLYRRDINIDSTNDATIPEAGLEYIYLGSFLVAAVTTQQYISMPAIPLFSGSQEFYLENDATQTMDADYVVKITPNTYNVA